MEHIHEIAELRGRLDAHRARGETVGFAPTMGALHDGHRSLALAAASNHDVGVLSIFVNPLQFAAGEDLDAYPRMLEADAAIAESVGIEYVFVPGALEMYPSENLTTVSVDGITQAWEGASRPTHFAGVATVVTKLFNIVGPCTAYFGEKDYQQLAMLRRMADDLNQPVTVVGMPTVRETDGLAMSSRNLRLLPEHRAEAAVVSRALRLGLDAVGAGETNPGAVEGIIRAELAATQHAEEPDYVAVVDAHTLQVPDVLDGDIRVLTAVRFGDVRLIDNMGMTVS